LDDDGMMTRVGRKMAEFPIDPCMAKLLLCSVDLKCSEEIVSILAILQVQGIFYRPRDKQALADQKKAKFHQNEGDHVTFLEVYKGYVKSRYSNTWCHENFIQSRAMKAMLEIRKQIVSLMDRYKYDLITCGRDYNRIRKAICAGYFRNACRKDPSEGYRIIVDNQQVFMHPSCSVYQRSPQWVIYHEIVLTTREYMRGICTIEPQWLPEIAPRLFNLADQNKISQRKKREKYEPLFNRFEEVGAWRLTKRRNLGGC